MWILTKKKTKPNEIGDMHVFQFHMWLVYMWELLKYSLSSHCRFVKNMEMTESNIAKLKRAKKWKNENVNTLREAEIIWTIKKHSLQTIWLMTDAFTGLLHSPTGLSVFVHLCLFLRVQPQTEYIAHRGAIETHGIVLQAVHSHAPALQQSMHGTEDSWGY